MWWEVAPEHGVNLSRADEQMHIRDFTPVHPGRPVGLIIHTRLGEGSPIGARATNERAAEPRKEMPPPSPATVMYLQGGSGPHEPFHPLWWKIYGPVLYRSPADGSSL